MNRHEWLVRLGPVECGFFFGTGHGLWWVWNVEHGTNDDGYCDNTRWPLSFRAMRECL